MLAEESEAGGQPDRPELYTGGWGDYYYDYFEFDLSGAPGSQETISATLTFYFSATGNDPAFQVMRITQAWTETGLTRSSNPSSTFYKDFPAMVSTGFHSLDITDLYKAWRVGPTRTTGSS